MAQHDMNIANQGFPGFRADLNNALGALVSTSSGATAPATTFAHQLWVDTSGSPSVLRIRNADNDAFIPICSIDQVNDKITVLNATQIKVGSVTYTLPTADGTSGQVIQTNGSGTLSFATSSSLTGTTDSASPFETSLGTGAGAVTTGVNNTFVGFEAGNDNSTGGNSTAVGFKALDVNTTGSGNTALGSEALGSNTTANNNTAIGYQALLDNTTGADNTAVGLFALQNNTTAVNNTAVGRSALDANTTGASNTAVGYQALDANTTGGQNTAVGQGTLQANTTGTNNHAFGRRSFANLTTGVGNVAIGDDTGVGTLFNVTTESNRGLFAHDAITNAYVKVAWTVTSDARDKTSIESVPHGLSFVNQLNPVSYRWKTSREDETPVGNRRYGFLAQEVMALEGDNPVIIDTEVPEKLKYQGESLVPVLVNAIKELSAQVTALQAEVNTLKGQP